MLAREWGEAAHKKALRGAEIAEVNFAVGDKDVLQLNVGMQDTVLREMPQRDQEGHHEHAARLALRQRAAALRQHLRQVALCTRPTFACRCTAGKHMRPYFWKPCAEMGGTGALCAGRVLALLQGAAHVAWRSGRTDSCTRLPYLSKTQCSVNAGHEAMKQSMAGAHVRSTAAPPR